MNIIKNNCVMCHSSFDNSIHLPRLLSQCGHTICSLCISRKLLSNNNTLSCPKDNTIYSNIDNIDYFQINKNILDKIKQNQKETNHNLIWTDSSKFDNIFSPQTQKTTKTKIDTITINDNSIINNTLLSSNNNQNNQQCYIRKIIKFGKKLKFSKDSLICSIHSLPLNIICVNDRQKICSQCALNNIHLNHQIIPENKFIEYVDELVKIYQEIETNINIYGDISNLNSAKVLDKIDKKINKIKNNVIKICEDLIDNLNTQCKQIVKFLDLRKNEIFNKYLFTNYDINNLRDSTNNWIDITCAKIIQANSGNVDELNIECLKLLDNDVNKNIFSLINYGKQLNERYNFISETKEIIDKLNEFYIKGINIDPNNNIIDAIKGNETLNDGLKDTKIYNNYNYNYNESIINTKGNSTLGNTNRNNNRSININLNLNNTNIFETPLFKIEENKDLIDSLHLTPISFLYKQTKNIFISYENDEFEDNNELCNTVANISNLISPKNKIHNNIYSKKPITLNRDYDASKNEYYITFKNDYMSRTQTTLYDLSSRLNLINSKEKQNSRQNRLALSGSLHNKTQSDLRTTKSVFMSQTFKKLLCPKFEKVKTCDVVFIASNKRKNSKDSSLSINTSNHKYKHEKTYHKFPMSPQIKNVYNIISNNIKEVDSSIKNIYDNKRNKRNKRKSNTNNKTDINSVREKEREKGIKSENKYKKKYTRCVSCSSSLLKKNNNIKDITILFNLPDKDKNKETETNEFGKKKTIKRNIDTKDTKDIKETKDNEISEHTSTNNLSEFTHHYNRSCIKKNSKTYHNLRIDKNNNNNNNNNNIHQHNSNRSKNRSKNRLFINKDKNELIKYINNQMKKNNPFFNRINMRGTGIELLCNYMEHNKKKKYKEMKLPGCNINDNDFCLLVKSLIDNEIEIPILNLSYNKISDNSAKYIFEIIKKKTCLKNIYLYNNIFSRNFIDKIKNYNKDKDVDNIKLYT